MRGLLNSHTGEKGTITVGVEERDPLDITETAPLSQRIKRRHPNNQWENSRSREIKRTRDSIGPRMTLDWESASHVERQVTDRRIVPTRPTR